MALKILAILNLYSLCISDLMVCHLVVLKKQLSKESATYFNDKTPNKTYTSHQLFPCISLFPRVDSKASLFLLFCHSATGRCSCPVIFLAQLWNMISRPWTRSSWDQTGIDEERKRKKRKKKRFLINDKLGNNKSREKLGVRQSGLKAMVYSPCSIRSSGKTFVFLPAWQVRACAIWITMKQESLAS